MRTYEDVVKIIKGCPLTQLASLLIVIAEECVRKGCFKSGGASRTVARVENRIALEKNESEPNPEVKLKIVQLTCGRCHSSFTLDTNYIHRTCGLNDCNGKLHRLGG